ncbi:ribonuclease J [Patescibacteria group bacterium]
MTNELKIIPLGGMGEVTKNMFAYETQTEILLVDCGIGFPDYTMLGVDILLPDISYLEDKKDKLVGLLLTHAHDDHIAGLPYILPKLPQIPIYASKLTAGFAIDRCRDSKIQLDIREIDTQEFEVGSFRIKPIPITHSVPDGRHFAITTPAGVVYHGSDYKFDENPVDGKLSDYETMKRVGEKGVIALLSDSLRSERPGHSLSESLLKETFEKEIKTTQGKFIVTVMSSNIHRIQQAVDVATEHNRKIAFVGRSIEQNVKTSQKLGFLHIPSETIHKRKIDDYSSSEVCIIIAGSQGQIGSSLERASKNDHDLVTIDPQDKVVFATEPIPGNEVYLYDTIDNISRLGVQIAYPEVRDEDTLHVSGHGSAEELKQLISLTKPKYLIPIGGAYRHMVQYKVLAEGMGYKKDQVFILDNGQTFKINQEGASVGKQIKLRHVIVDGLGVGDVGQVVLSDRRRMAESGILVVVVLIGRNNGKIIGNPEVISRGFVYMKNSKKLISDIAAKTKDNLPKSINQNDWSGIKSKIEKNLQKLVYKQTRRQPLILPVIREV